MLGYSLGRGFATGRLSEGVFHGTDHSLRRIAPDFALYGNVGAAQLREYRLADMQRAVDMIGAGALIIHLNPLQEALQAGGDTRWNGLLPTARSPVPPACWPAM